MTQNKMPKPKKRVEKKIRAVYFNTKHPGGFGGVQKLKKALKNKVSSSDISNWLADTDTYTLHKPLKKSFLEKNMLCQALMGYGSVIYQIYHN